MRALGRSALAAALALAIGSATGRPAAGQNGVLFDNGPFVTSLGTAPGGADESILQHNTLGHSVLGFYAEVTLDIRMADDFTVSDPAGWQVDEIVFVAYQTGAGLPSTLTEARVEIWDGDPSAPASSRVFGDLTTNRLASTTWTGAYRVSETTAGTSTHRALLEAVATVGTVLAPGTYWVVVQFAGSHSSGPFTPPVTIAGQAVTGDAIQYLSSIAQWSAAVHGNGDRCGLIFVVRGSVGSPGFSYCTAKLGLTCGLPAIGSAGTPSASATSGFTIRAEPARSQRTGLFLYTDQGRANVAFQGGTLCLTPLIRRSSAVGSGGTSACDGAFAIDWNAFAAGLLGGNPQSWLRTPGQLVNVQAWGRDSPATGSFLSDALEYLVQP